MTFSLSRAAPGDARPLAELAARAFAHDAHTQVKAAVRPPGDFADGMTQGFEAWLAAPARCVVLKAADDRDGRLVGSICWAFRGVEVDPPPPPPPPPTKKGEPPAPAVAAGTVAPIPKSPRADPPPAPSTPSPSAAAVARVGALEEMTNAHLAAFQQAVMPEGTRCLYVVAVAVDPRAQGRGVGSQLLRWGLERADRAGVFCWVHASAAGAAVFARHGFREVDRLAVDLDQWAAGPPPPSSGEHRPPGAGERWGEYVFRYMVRQPKEHREGAEGGL